MSSGNAASELLQELLRSQQTKLNSAIAVRDLTLACAVILVRDCIRSFRMEQNLIWPKPPSFTKYSYLVNRYLVPTCFVTLFMIFSGFLRVPMGDSICGWTLCVITTIFPCSLALGNILVIARVVHLWDNNQRVLWIMSVGFVVAYGVSLSTLVVGLARMKAGMVFEPVIRMCVTTTVSKLLIAAVAAPMGFEILVFIAIYWNTLDRPRVNDVPLMKALVKDGGSFFGYISVLRAMHVALVAVQNPAIIMLGMLIVWATVTIMLSRRLLSLYMAGLESSVQLTTPHFTRGLLARPELRHEARRAKSSWAAGDSIELGRVEVELSTDHQP